MKNTMQKIGLIKCKKAGVLIVCLLSFMETSPKIVGYERTKLETNEDSWLNIPASNSKIRIITPTPKPLSVLNTLKKKRKKTLGSVVEHKSETTACVPVAGVIYVDGSIASSGSGNCWETAFKTLREAVLYSHSNTSITTIHIAKGTYYTTGTQNSTERNVSFLLPLRSNLALYGGYPNGGGTRDVKGNPTILSGDIGTPNDASDNSYHVLIITNIQPQSGGSIIIDGLTITGGNANGSEANETVSYNGLAGKQNEGGGILLRTNGGMGDNIIIRNTTIIKNSASADGGGIYMLQSSALIHNCIITGNTAAKGGGIFANNTPNPRIVSSVIVKNSATDGAGIYCTNTSTSLKAINCTLVDNTASWSGNSLHNNGQATFTIANSIIWSGSANRNIYHTTTPLNITYSNVLTENGVHAGTGNINQSPFFQNIENYRLMSCSSGINSGSNDAINNAPSGSFTYDMLGNPRIVGTNVDMGASELQGASGTTNITIATPTSKIACLGSVFPETSLTGSSGQLCFIMNENTSQTIAAPSGMVFTEVIFASYGNASGNCTTGFIAGSCNAANSRSVIEELALGKNSFNITLISSLFGVDPCLGTTKKLCLTLKYEPRNYSWINSNPAIGLPASGTGSIPSFTAQQAGTATITLTTLGDLCTTVTPATFTYTVEEDVPLYVDGNVTASGNGKSWATALKTLKEAMEKAVECGSIKTIHIAKGTYYPTGTQNGTDRNATFLLPRRGRIELYGGYPNGGGTRNIVDNPTILSGEIGNPTDIADNSYHVMVGTNMLPGAETVIIDGITIRGGNANGGQYTYNDQLINQSEGGGLVLGSNNNLEEKIIIRNTIITKNRANSQGGGLYLGNSSALVHNTVISENTSLSNGGGVFIYETANPRFINSSIVKNTAANGGGVFSMSTLTTMKILNCTLADNNANSNGDNLHNNGQATTTIINSIIWGNNAAKNIYHLTAPLDITYSNIQKASDVYEGTGNINQDPLFINASRGNYLTFGCSPVINTGNNTAIASAPSGSVTLDILGNPRTYENNVDMGAYELQTAAGITSLPITAAPSSQTTCMKSFFPLVQLTTTAGQVGQICKIISENANETIAAPAGAVFTEVTFASYGNATGDCASGFTMGTCNATNSKSLIESLALGNNSFTIKPNVAGFGDPCNGTLKRLCLTMTYSYPEVVPNEPICKIINENTTETIKAPAGAVFTEVIFASYGVASGDCASGFTLGSCNVTDSKSIIESLALGKNSFTINPTTAFTDPCLGIQKRLYVTLAYAYPQYSWTNDNPAIGLAASGIGNIPTFTPAEIGTANITLNATLNDCIVFNPYTFTYKVNNLVAYVDGNVSASGDGSSWSTAFKTLKEAMEDANYCGDNKKIYVAKGTYYPTGEQNGTDREATFLLPQNGGIEIYGGYPNGGGLRDASANPTILSGEIGNPGSTADNSYHVMTLANALPGATQIIIDGLTITGGNANFYSSYIYHGKATPRAYGGGIMLFENPSIGDRIAIQNCIIRNNSANDAGGGIYAERTSAYLLNSRVLENTQANTAGEGGAGIGLKNPTGSGFRVINSLVCNNSANAGSARGGGVSISIGGYLSIVSSTIAYNTASMGDNVAGTNANIAITNSIVWGYNANNVIRFGGGTLGISHSNIPYTTSFGTANITQDPLFTNVAAGNYKPLSCSPVINAGHSPAVVGTTDVLGNPRLYGDQLDMGAYEHQATAGIVNFTIPTPPSSNIQLGTVFLGQAFSEQYPQLAYSWTNDNPAIGLPASGAGNIPSFTATQAGVANITLTASTDICTISNPVTFKYAITTPTVYVDANVQASGNGTSWTQAFKTLKEAMDRSQYGVIKTINIAKGTYYPTGVQNGTDRNTTFLFPQRGIELYGGYPNGGGIRNVKANPTILSGDVGVLNSTSDNSYHVVSVVNSTGTEKVVIDGLTITAGNANGGSQFTYNGKPTNQNEGGGLFLRSNDNLEGEMIIRDVTITNNQALRGAGFYMGQSSPLVQNTVIIGNDATTGGGIYALEVPAPKIINSVISNNTANNAAGIYSSHASNSLNITNSTITANTASSLGDSLLNTNSATTTVTNSILWSANAARNITNYSTLNASYSNILQTSGVYLGAGNMNQDPLFANPANKDFRLQDTSSSIDKGYNLNPDLTSITTDMDLNKRIIGLSVDMGAYESRAPLGSCLDDTVWNGTTWSNGAPDTNKKAFVNGDLTLSTNLQACELEVTEIGSLNIPSGRSFSVNDKVVNKATEEYFTIESGGSLLQTNNVQNTGAITVRRNSFPLYRQDYTLWGSPVAQQNLRSFSPQTLFNRFYSYDTAAGTVGEYVQEIFTTQDMQDKLFNPAEGYMVRMPNDWPVYVNNTIAGTSYQGKFEGVPNNGNIAIPLSTANTAVNLVANPYPSPISITALLNANPGIQRTVYFWRKRNGVAGSGYASYNAFGLASPQPEINGLDLQDVIAVGQGFFVKSTGATTLNFNNQMRSASAGNMMMRSAQEEERHRIWLDLSNSSDVIGQALLGYATGATEGADNGLDGTYFNDSPAALTSLIGNAEYAIQARPVPFDVADEVHLGFKTNAAGTYTISLSNADGLFSDTQDIFLKDSQNSQLHDLRQSAYSFTTSEGTFNNRFSVVYQSTLDTKNPELDPNSIVVYRKDRQLHVNSGRIVMQKIELFDIRGRLIHTLDEIDSTTARIQQLDIANQVLIMKITSVENKTTIKKVIY